MLNKSYFVSHQYTDYKLYLFSVMRFCSYNNLVVDSNFYSIANKSIIKFLINYFTENKINDIIPAGFLDYYTSKLIDSNDIHLTPNIDFVFILPHDKIDIKHIFQFDCQLTWFSQNMISKNFNFVMDIIQLGNLYDYVTSNMMNHGKI